ncbi:peptidase inhibitor family I36 protein [Streptomyces sp. Z423-1]|uniref:peptidase inhibitor family I36 protein n=1 Tax=unclassified Streptomyces TaxID=2593676 RepID=UPI0014897A3E|nr:peptidase inhibitor family I36 protein [Streptomyces sp. Z423-1]
MKRIMRKAVTMLAVSAAAAGVALLPAGAAQADEPVNCPRVIAFCTFEGPDGYGRMRLYFQDEPSADPSFHTAQNQTPEPWCVYELPGYGGLAFEVPAWGTVRQLPFAARSLHQGSC